MEKLSDKEWWALRRYSTAPLSEIWRDAIDIVLLQRPTSYTVEEVCAAYNKPKPKTEETAASWNEEQIRKSICSAWQPWWSADIDGPNFADHVYAALKGQKPKTACEECATFSCKHNAEYIAELIAKVQLVTDSANEMRRIRQTDLATCQGMVDRKEQMRRNAEKLSALLQEENAMLKAQIKQLEDSRFALAVAHTEDVLTIERLTAEGGMKEEPHDTTE